MEISTFLAAHAALPWVWGSVDGALAPFDWAISNGKADGAYWRGSYSSETELRNIVVSRGSLVNLVNDSCSRIGFSLQGNASLGNIGVIGSKDNVNRQWAAIYDGLSWQTFSPVGFVQIRMPALCVWGF